MLGCQRFLAAAFRAGAEAERGPAATTSYLELDAADLRAEDRPLSACWGLTRWSPAGSSIAS